MSQSGDEVAIFLCNLFHHFAMFCITFRGLKDASNDGYWNFCTVLHMVSLIRFLHHP